MLLPWVPEHELFSAWTLGLTKLFVWGHLSGSPQHNQLMGVS